MEPYYQDELVTIYHGDCLEILPQLAIKADLIVTDPPYFLPARISGTRKVFYRSLTELSLLEYFFRDFFSCCNGISKPTAIYYLFCDGQSYPVFYSLLFGYVKAIRPLIWDKLTSINGYGWRHQHELILFAENIEAPLVRTGDGDILKCRAVKVGERQHPAEKPVDLLKRLISKHSEGMITVDPLMGIGSTLKATKELNRHSVGIEVEEKYCEIAALRCCQAESELQQGGAKC